MAVPVDNKNKKIPLPVKPGQPIQQPELQQVEAEALPGTPPNISGRPPVAPYMQPNKQVKDKLKPSAYLPIKTLNPLIEEQE